MRCLASLPSVLNLKHNTDTFTLTHTARFSPDDKFSRHRVTLKKRFGLLLTQQPTKPM